MFDIDDVEEYYNLSSSMNDLSKAKETKNQTFFDKQKEGYINYDKDLDDYGKRRYCKIGFANYWRNTIETQMEKKGDKISDLRIQMHMIQSLPVMNAIADFYQNLEMGNISNKDFLTIEEIEKIKNPYTDSLCNQFFVNNKSGAMLTLLGEIKRKNFIDIELDNYTASELNLKEYI